MNNTNDIFLFTKKNNKWIEVLRPPTEDDYNLLNFIFKSMNFSEDLDDFATKFSNESFRDEFILNLSRNVEFDDIMDRNIDFKDYDSDLEDYNSLIEQIKNIFEIIKSDFLFEIGDKNEINLILTPNKLQLFYEDFEMELKLITKDYIKNIDIYEVGDKTLTNASYLKFVFDTIHGGNWFKFYMKNGDEWIYVKSPRVKNIHHKNVLLMANEILK